MKTLIMIILCSLPLIGWGQNRTTGKETYPVEVYKIANRNLEKEVEMLRKEVKVYKEAYLTYKQLYTELKARLKENERLDSIKKAQQFMEDDGIVFRYPIWEEVVNPDSISYRDSTYTLKPIIK
jgi:FMN-dependent NADH-azoreductase